MNRATPADHQSRDRPPQLRQIHRQKQKARRQHPKPKDGQEPEKPANRQHKGNRKADREPTASAQVQQGAAKLRDQAFQHLELPMEPALAPRHPGYPRASRIARKCDKHTTVTGSFTSGACAKPASAASSGGQICDPGSPMPKSGHAGMADRLPGTEDQAATSRSPGRGGMRRRRQRSGSAPAASGPAASDCCATAPAARVHLGPTAPGRRIVVETCARAVTLRPIPLGIRWRRSRPGSRPCLGSGLHSPHNIDTRSNTTAGQDCRPSVQPCSTGHSARTADTLRPSSRQPVRKATKDSVPQQRLS